MIKVETAKATKLQLDWGVAVIETQNGVYHECGWDEADGVWVQHFGEDPMRFSHSVTSVWAELIKEHKINVSNYDMSTFYPNNPDLWKAAVCFGSDNKWAYGDGDTPEQAIARCVISKVLGKTFDVPDELGVQS